ncbi:hypothetical protein B0J11DRAFT_509388 [Dendryphion nanum]|uniref:Uncharacterized protein n=1 Tax=Dendryphion nanum TaxID=256645 RepID=A0A9P9DEW9_9PLEO|nr:hypothetical protein B0J11DRAFT_509388 [Dendryphion nanum]
MVGAFVSGPKAAIVAILFFIFFYGLFIDAVSSIHGSEIYPTNIRSPGVVLATFYVFHRLYYLRDAWCCGDSKHWLQVHLFACLTHVSIVVIYFMYPETNNKSLEELAQLFGHPVVVHLTAAPDEGRAKMDMEIKNELFSERREVVNT